MSQWLVETEPGIYSPADPERDGTTQWKGASDHLRVQHLRSRRSGDRDPISHTGHEKSIIGIAAASCDPCPTACDLKRFVIDPMPVRTPLAPVPFGAVRRTPEMADDPLLCLSRLSVMPLSLKEWKAILALSR